MAIKKQTIEDLKTNTFIKMCRSGEIATNNDNEKWVHGLIQTGYDFAIQNSDVVKFISDWAKRETGCGYIVGYTDDEVLKARQIMKKLQFK